MAAVKSLCTTGLLMKNGSIEAAGAIDDVVLKYTAIGAQGIESLITIEKESEGFTIHSVSITDNGINGHFNIENDLTFSVIVSGSVSFESVNINIFFKSADDSLIFATCSKAENLPKGNLSI